MDHNARFAADSLHKEYPEPELFPKDACVVFVCSGSVSVRKGSTPTIVEKASPGLPEVLKMNAQYLGHRGPVPLYAIEVPGELPLPEGRAYSGIRELAGLVPDEELAIAGLAVQIIEYDRTTRFCGRCGAETRPAGTERAKVCPSCDRVMYPRLSPAVIVLVRNHDAILMVRGKSAPPGRYSLIAGFVEPGETIEHAVHREVREEAGVAIKNIRYRASEPWPFPDSIMLGFVAEYDGGEPASDGTEIESAAWFDRDHLPDLPPKLGITRALIDDWIASHEDRTAFSDPFSLPGRSDPAQFPGSSNGQSPVPSPGSYDGRKDPGSEGDVRRSIVGSQNPPNCELH